MKTQKLIEKWVSETVEITFSHNRNSVDVKLWSKNNSLITIVQNSSADIFLKYFDYGQVHSEIDNKVKEYLLEIL